jgi:hypothetical protein
MSEHFPPAIFQSVIAKFQILRPKRTNDQQPSSAQTLTEMSEQVNA